MAKIPVGRTIGQAYRLSFRGYFTILGIVWLPLLLMIAAGYFLYPPVLHDFMALLRASALHPGDPSAVSAAMNGSFSRIYGLDFLVLLLAIWIQVGITKEVLGLRKGPRFVYLPSGADEGRVLLTYMVLFILSYVGIIVIAIVAAIIGVAVYAMLPGDAMKQWNPHAFAGPVVAAAIVAVELAFFYVLIRLFYFVGPATVAERHLVFGRSWQLTRGNFWRIFVILLATLLPIYLVEVAPLGMVIVPVLHQFAATPHSADPAVFFEALWASISRLLPYYAAMVFVIAPVIHGLLVSSTAFAYRALVPKKDDAPAKPPGTLRSALY
jgi:hypothetical protein